MAFPAPCSGKDAWLALAIVGAGIAGVLWLAASTLFSVYVANFGSYKETYGSLGAIVGLMLWL